MKKTYEAILVITDEGKFPLKNFDGGIEIDTERYLTREEILEVIENGKWDTPGINCEVTQFTEVKK